MKTINIIIVFAWMTANLFAVETWNIIDKSMSAWDVNEGESYNKAWKLTRSGSVPANAVTKYADYANITKTAAGGNTNYGFLIPDGMDFPANTPYTIEVKARIKPIDKTLFPDVTGKYESNEISARINEANFGIHLKYGDETEGYVALTAALTHSPNEKYLLNTLVWHRYRFVLYPGNTFDVYIDDAEEPLWEGIRTGSMTGDDIIRLGAAKEQRANIDVEYVKVKTGISGIRPRITAVEVSADSYLAGREHTVQVTAHTTLVNDGEKLTVTLTDEAGNDYGQAPDLILQSGTATQSLSIPALPAGRYCIKVAAPNDRIGENDVSPKKIQYDIVPPSPFSEQLLPSVTPVGFLIELEDYKYKSPSNEFISPTIVDTKKSTLNGKFLNGETPDDRYYLFYSPHENPGGMYLATAPALDGPWTERNTVIDLAWAKAVVGNNVNKADHISACNVIWNDVQNKYFMYFHGPNTTTHYAVSDNLKDWTFGKSIFNAQSFGSLGNEASYSKIFEYSVPGLGNKYIKILMINEGNIRKVFWAHSNDGIDWVCNKKPLVSPNLEYKKIPGTGIKPNYTGSFGNNVAGSFFMKAGNRYFVFVTGSSGNLCVIEVGESLDMEVHWGEYMQANTVLIDTDESGQKKAVPRISSSVFIRDDGGRWYMFFEAGSRLGANIAYAREDVAGSAIAPSPAAATVAVYPSIVNRGGNLTIHAATAGDLSVEIMDVSGKIISAAKIAASSGDVRAPETAGVYFVRVNRTGISRIVVR